MTNTTHNFSWNQDGSRQYVWALCLALAMAATVGIALVFEHGFGFIPCKLCLAQREPYYVAFPLALIASLAAWRAWPGCVSRGLLAIVGLLMLYGLVLGVYHSGVEWQFWTGPTDCGATAGSAVDNASDLLGMLDTVRAPACDQAAGRFLGLSFAGWNVVASALFAAAALRAATGPAD
jgi:disulfide bond formation protein DsbB